MRMGLQCLTPSSSQAFIAARMVDVAPAVSGRVSSVSVKATKSIDEGDILFQIDLTDAEKSKSQTKSQDTHGLQCRKT
jgi:multidrug resistance efflux pump